MGKAAIQFHAFGKENMRVIAPKKGSDGKLGSTNVWEFKHFKIEIKFVAVPEKKFEIKSI